MYKQHKPEATILSQHYMSSSLAINSLFHCLPTYYITSTERNPSYSVSDFTTPYNSKVTSKEVSQSLVQNIKNKFSPIWYQNSSLAKTFSNYSLKNSLVNVHTHSTDFLINPTGTYGSIWLTFHFHSQRTEFFN